MTIGGWDISNADARQWNVSAGGAALINNSEWGTGRAMPSLMQTFYGFKELSVSLMVKASGGRQTLRNRCSTIIAKALNPCEIVLDGFSNGFYGFLRSYEHQETSMRHWHVLTLVFAGYEHGSQQTVTQSRATSFTVSNSGNVATPCRIEITPLVSTATVTLTGLCRDQAGNDESIIVKNTTANKVIVLDGETGLFTEDGANKAADITIWRLPALLPGSNTITVDSAYMSVSIKYKPRYI